MNNTKDTIKIIGVVALLLMPFGCTALYQHGTAETVRITVKDKERVTYSTGSGENKGVKSKYLIFTETETFENVDAWFSGKFASSDLYGKLDKGQSYTIRAYGWRVPFLSWYRNIVRIED